MKLTPKQRELVLFLKGNIGDIYALNNDRGRWSIILYNPYRYLTLNSRVCNNLEKKGVLQPILNNIFLLGIAPDEHYLIGRYKLVLDNSD